MPDSLLQNVVKVVLLPPMSLLWCGMAGIILARAGWGRTGRTIMAASLAGIFLLSTEAVTQELVDLLERRTAPLDRAGAAQAKAIVVLGAGTVPSPPEYGTRFGPDYIALARIRYAARLHWDSGLPILASGGYGSGEAISEALENEFHIPVRWTEVDSLTTAQNAANSARILREAGIAAVLLVTDAMHMPRAKMSFQSCGLQVVAAPTMFLGGLPFQPSQLVPSIEALRRANYASYEWAGLAWYQLFQPPCAGHLTGD